MTQDTKAQRGQQQASATKHTRTHLIFSSQKGIVLKTKFAICFPHDAENVVTIAVVVA